VFIVVVYFVIDSVRKLLAAVTYGNLRSRIGLDVAVRYELCVSVMPQDVIAAFIRLKEYKVNVIFAFNHSRSQ
jgi:hypothetical protein